MRPIRTKQILILSSTALLTLSACAQTGGNSSRPQELTLVYVGQASTAAKKGDWWAPLNDSKLTALLRRGERQNLPLNIALERVRQAEARLNATAPILGSTSASGSASRQNTQAPGATANAWSSARNLSATYVIDLYGSKTLARVAARAGVVQADVRVVEARQAFQAELISAYSDLRFAQAGLSITNQMISARSRMHDVTRAKHGLGAASPFDLAQSEASLTAARAELPLYRQRIESSIVRIAILMNEQPASIRAEMGERAQSLALPPANPRGVPADLLRYRPDVAIAEQAVIAATAEAGIARNDMLPSITLSGNIGTSAGGKGWSFGPQVNLAILDRGGLRAESIVKGSMVRQKEMEFKMAINEAVGDVIIAQSDFIETSRRFNHLNQSYTARERAYELAHESFEIGQMSLTELLEIDAPRWNTRLQAAAARNEAIKAWAALQIATGTEFR